MDTLELGEKRADELGLKLVNPGTQLRLFYYQDDIHKLLGEGECVYGFGKAYPDMYNWAKRNSSEQNTHQALLIGIKPIVKDTAEQLVRDIARDANERGGHVLSDYIKRAKALLEKK